MRTILFLIAGLIALLVATNPSRSEFNDWIMQYSAQKVRDLGRVQRREVGWTERVIGGYATGWAIASLPVARSNYLVFSIYRVDLPYDLRREFPSCIIAVAGQFIPRNAC